MRNISEARFVIRILCSDCGAQLNETIPIDCEKIYKDWGQLCLTSGFVVGQCPNGCRMTFSDLNINTDLVIFDADIECPVEYRTFKLLHGEFYASDHSETCDCAEAPDEEIYFSERYPAVHGRCGRWMEKYESFRYTTS